MGFRSCDTPYLGRDQQDNVNLFQVLRRLGELYEQAGNRQKAVEYYDRFVDLWANAEPALQPQIDQVRERLANLAAR